MACGFHERLLRTLLPEQVMLSPALPTRLRLSPFLVTGSHPHLLLARPG